LRLADILCGGEQALAGPAKVEVFYVLTPKCQDPSRTAGGPVGTPGNGLIAPLIGESPHGAA
jgi:hypothetical protein